MWKLTVRQSLVVVCAWAGASLGASSALAQPANDNCATATPLAVGMNANLTNVDATPSGVVASCGFDASFTEDVWFTFTVPAGQSGIWSIDTSNSTGLDDTVVTVYATCGGPEIACDDDAGDPGFQSRVLTYLAAGQTYRIRVAGYDGSEGLFNIAVAFEATAASDECASATPLPLGHTLTANTLATNSGNVQVSCAFDTTYVHDVFFSFDPPAPGDYHVQIGGELTQLFDTVLSVHPSCTLSTEIACDDDGSPLGEFLSALTFNSPAGAPVIFRVGVVAGDVGLMEISVQQVFAITNDNCIDADPISIGVTNGTTLSATSSGVVASCGFDATFTEDVWYSFTPTSSGSYLVDTEQSTILTDTVLSVYSACGGTQIACDDDGGAGLLSRLTFTATTPNTYFIRVAGYNHSEGAFTLNLAPVSAIPNDTCATASAASIGANSGTSLGATSSGPAPACAFDSTYTEDVWFVFTAPSSNVFSFNTNGSTGLTDTVLSILDECNGAQLACDDDGGAELHSAISLRLAAGEDYFIRIAGGSGSEGAFVLNIADLGPGVSNDSCSGAIALSAGTHVRSSAGALPGNPEASCSSGGDTEDVWFSFTAPAAGFYQIDTNGSAGAMADTTLTVFSGPCGNLAELRCDDDSGTGLQSLVRVSLAMNQTVFIRVAGFAGTEGPFALSIAQTTPAPGQACEIPVTLTPGVAASYDSTGDVNDLFVTCSSFDGADAFFVFTPPAGAIYDIYMEPSPNVDAVLSVIGSCVAPSALACADDGLTGETEHLTYTASAGQSVLIRTADANGFGGPFTILAVIDGPGACCTGLTCSVETEEDCQVLGGVYQGNGVACSGPLCSGEPTPCEQADFNGSGSVDATDIFIFLDAWFAQNGMSGPDLSADTNSSGNVDATDIFIYLDLWFAQNGMAC